MNRKVIIDTNVLVSALLSSHEDSATVRMLMLLLSTACQMTVFQDTYSSACGL